MENRMTSYQILPEILPRWSPRAFDPERSVSDEDLSALLEAARFAPSCFNEQPWSYIVARDKETHSKIRSVLTASNDEWASKAPVLLMILSRQRFLLDDRENRWHLFDAGTSWGYLSLEAQKRGLITHAMGGFNASRAREAFGIPESYSIIAVVAIGYYGRIEELSLKNQAREHPSPRKTLDEMMFSRPPVVEAK